MAMPTFRDRMIAFLIHEGTGDYDWPQIEEIALKSMSIVQICIYEIYIRFTRDVTIIVPLFNTTFGVSCTHQQIDYALVPVRALVLLKYKFEEVQAVFMEARARDVGYPFDEREVYYWRFMVDSQVNQTCLARLLYRAAPNWAYVSDCSDSSEDEEDYCSSDLSVGGEDSDSDEYEKEQLEGIVRVNPMTGRGYENRPIFYRNLYPTRRPWDSEDGNISANVAADPILRRSLMEDLGKRGKNAIIEDRSEAVKEIIKDRQNQNFRLWRCTTALTRLLAKKGSLNSLRRQNYDFAGLLELAPFRDWFAAKTFTARQFKEDLCMVIEVVGEERHFYRAEQDGDGRLIRVWTKAEGCGPMCTRGNTQRIERKKPTPVSKEQAKKKCGKKQKTKAAKAILKQTSSAADKISDTDSESASPCETSKSCHSQCRFLTTPTSVQEKQIWALVELLARCTTRDMLTGKSLWGVPSVGFWSAWRFSCDVEDEDFEELFFKNFPLEDNSEDRLQSSTST